MRGLASCVLKTIFSSWRASKMERKHSQKELILQNLDVLGLILSFIPFDGSNWLNVRLTCKTFLQTSFQAFDPTVNNNCALKWAIENGNTKVVEDLFKD